MKRKMNSSKSEDDGPLFHHHRRHRRVATDSSVHLLDPSFSLLFRHPVDNSPLSSDDDSAPPTASSPFQTLTLPHTATQSGALSPRHPSLPTPYLPFINPKPHISPQFFTFTSDSHSLMIQCLLDRRLAMPPEIRAAVPPEVLGSWRLVWKDRNEDTAHITGWKRIQDKLQAQVDDNGKRFLCFKNNNRQFVSHVDQWQEIVMAFHCDGDLRHLGVRDTIDRIKKVWTVGAKFYGIPDSFIRVCVAECPLCNGPLGRDGGILGGAGPACSNGRSKRRRFEYTESFDVPAKEVPNRLQQLAKKHKVVLCIRQKYIRYKPFMAEVKDYACHRAGEPASKKSKVLKREPYASKRCGCGFRIRAIVPISNYNEKDKTFVYQEEGMAVFKLYAVHTGHQPGPLDGNARIMHRVLGHKGEFLMDQEDEYGVNEDMDTDVFGSVAGANKGEFYATTLLEQVQQLKNEVGLLERNIKKIPHDQLGSLSSELYDVLNKVRILREEASRPSGLLSDRHHSDAMLVSHTDLAHWGNSHAETLYGHGEEADLIEDDEDSFGRTLEEVSPWDQMGTECGQKIIDESCRADKWLNSNKFDEKSFLVCNNSKLNKPVRHDDSLEADVGLVGIQVDSFYPENPKWYDSPCGLHSSTDCGDSEFQDGELV